MPEHLPNSNADTDTDAEKEQSSEKKIVDGKKIFLALLVSFAILAYYFYDQDWQGLSLAIKDANVPLAVLAVVLLVLNNWFFEVLLRGVHFNWFHEGLQGKFPWRDYFWMRGALYLILVVNGPLSGAARVLYLVNKTKISWTLYFGIGFFRLILRAGLIALVMLAFSYLLVEKQLLSQAGIPYFYWFAFIFWNLFVFVDAYLAFMNGRFLGLTRLIENKLDHEFFAAFNKATLYQWLWTLVVGTFPMVIFLFCYWMMALAFNIDIPLWYFSLSIVFVLILSNLPIAFGGFGTTTMAWMLFYKDYADESLLLGFTLFLPTARLLVHGTVGLLCLKPALADFFTLLDEAKNNNEQKVMAQQDLKSLFSNKK
jgi:hypothetical protein